MRVTDDTGTGVTVTLHVAVASPHLAVIFATPTATAVTLPSASTVAIDSLSDDQVMTGLVTFSGETVAVSLSVAPTSRVIS